MRHACLVLVGTLALAGARADDEANVRSLSREYQLTLRDAAEDFRLENFDRVLRRVDQLDKIQPDAPVALNLRGAVATSQRDFDKALGYFKRATEAAPEYFAPRFNLGEILFLQQIYPEARKHFEGMIEGAGPSQKELLMFKVFMCCLMAGDLDQAAVWKDKIPFPSDTPAYYFTNAAWEFKAGRAAQANEWIESSARIFKKEANELYVESLIDVGWLSKRPPEPALPGGP